MDYKNKKALKDWLEKNFTRVNKNWSAPPRLLDTTQKRIAQQQEFETLAEMLISRMSLAMKAPKNIQFALIDEKAPNAWAFWPANFDALLITTGLVTKIQEVCGQVSNLMEQGMRLPADKVNLMRNLWTAVPAGNQDYGSLGGLLAHIAYTFIIHHELAHIGLGHEAVHGPLLSRSAADQDVSEDEISVVDESSMAAASAANIDPARLLDIQTLEADADLNALAYTVEFMTMQAHKFDAREVGVDDLQGTVWKAFLLNMDRQWFVIIAGVIIGLLCLIQTSGKQTIGDMRRQSHPPVPARVLVTLHAARIRYQSQNPGAPMNLSDTLLFVLSLFGFLQIAKNKEAVSPDMLTESYGFDDAIKRFSEIGERYQVLSENMVKLENKCSHLRRFNDYLGWKWYKN